MKRPAGGYQKYIQRRGYVKSKRRGFWIAPGLPVVSLSLALAYEHAKAQESDNTRKPVSGKAKKGVSKEILKAATRSPFSTNETGYYVTTWSRPDAGGRRRRPVAAARPGRRGRVQDFGNY